ncbi:MAG: biosynthetic arginine decarboxylase [Candidatus Kapaibacteriales bacterium]
MRKWRIEDSLELYNITGWGQNYFSINEKGNLFVSPSKNGAKIDLKELVDELVARDVSPPFLIRFPNIIDDRIENITRCFEDASKEYGFKGKYYNVYPIKVNQVRPVVEEIIQYGKKYNIGLEAGSKPELHVVLAVSSGSDSLIICNGYKDESFIELALLAQKMGKKIFVVVEKLSELRLLISIAKRLKIRPNIGVRIKLSTQGSGKWEDSAGDKSKFGLNASELIEAFEIINSHKLLDHLKLIHFHIGSQITNIRMIKNALRECSQFYAELKKMGAGVEFVDIGGGLGVDYDGTRSFSPSSINYTIKEYVDDAVYMLKEASDKNNLPHPNVITESGRSLTAHHSVLVFDVLETTSNPTWNYERDEIEANDHENVKELFNLLQKINPTNLLESWHDAQQIREDSLDLFSLGLLDLKTRAKVEKLFWSIAKEVYTIGNELKHMPDEIRPLEKWLADKYFCNFSLFQSLPDSWAIDQIFPIVPIHRLDEKPTHIATLHDITCDSDGKIENFIGYRSFSHFLPVHELRPNEPYYIGVFLVGAYQEILGDLHNLFGDTNAVHVIADENNYKIVQIIDGETVAEVLDYVQYDAKKLVRIIETWVTSSVKEGKISPQEGKEFLSNYRSGLYGYTYLE